MLDFDTKGHDIFRRWYVDGRLFYHKVIDKKIQDEVFKRFNTLTHEKIKKVREVDKDIESSGYEVFKKTIKKTKEVLYLAMIKVCLARRYGSGSNEGPKIMIKAVLPIVHLV